MKFKKTILLFSVLNLIFYASFYGQSENTTKKNGKYLFDKGNTYLKKGDFDSCIFYTEKAVKLLNTDFDLSNAYENLGMAFFYKNYYSKALDNFKKSLHYAENMQNDSIKARRYSDLGAAYDYLGAYDKAVEHYIKAYKIFDRRNDLKGLSKIFNNLGIINETMEKYEKAVFYYKKSLDLKEKTKAKQSEIASTYVNLGSVSEKTGKYETAYEYYRKALSVFKTKQNKTYTALCLNNIANIYILKNEQEKAAEYVKEAIAINKNSENSIILAKSYIILSRILISENKLKQASEYLEKAKKISYKQNFIEQQKLISETEISLYEKEKDFKTAYKLQKKFIKNQEKLYKQKIKEKAEKLQIVYETDKKEQQIKNLTAGIKQKRISLILMVSALILILISGYLFFRNKLNKAKIKNYVFKQKLLRSQMNPHFMYNALNSIQTFMLENDTHKAAMYLSAFAKLSRSILNNSRQEFVSIQEEINTIKNYLKIQVLRTSDLFEYEINVDENLDADYFMMPPMLMQPFIENAVLHAFKNINHKGKIKINFIIKNNNMLKISVEDNGTGYKPENNKKHKSQALKITYERLKILKKQTKKNIKFKIINLSDISQKTGTKVIFTIPLIKNKKYV